MECEQFGMVVSASLREYDRTGKAEKVIGGSHYYCGNCDSEWTWTQGVRGLLQVDGAAHDQGRTDDYRGNG